MAVSPVHAALTQKGAAWLKKNGFGVVATELTSLGLRERPDVLGFRSSCSAMIEVKVSRADFLADQRKPERHVGGIGVYRFYLCPEGLIRPEELPLRWGLLYATGRSVTAVVKAGGNLWPALVQKHPEAEAVMGEWRDFQHESDPELERKALYSIARRLTSGCMV